MESSDRWESCPDPTAADAPNLPPPAELLYSPPLCTGVDMAIEVKTGQTIRVTISKTINRAAAKKTLERLFFKDKSIKRPIDIRSANFKELPKRRGGCIW